MDVQFAALSHLARSFSSQKVPTFREQTAASELHVNDVAGQNVLLCDGSERRAEVPTSITANTATL